MFNRYERIQNVLYFVTAEQQESCRNNVPEVDDTVLSYYKVLKKDEALTRPLERFRFSQCLRCLFACFRFGENVVPPIARVLLDEARSVPVAVFHNGARQVRLERLRGALLVRKLDVPHCLTVLLVARMMVTANPAATQDIGWSHLVNVGALGGCQVLVMHG